METIEYKKILILIVVLFTAWYAGKTIFEGIRAWLGYPRKRQHVQYGKILRWLLLAAFVLIEIFVRTNGHHQPRGTLFYIHIGLDVVLVATYLLLSRKYITPRLHGAWHYGIGIIFALSFLGSAITGGILLYNF